MYLQGKGSFNPDGFTGDFSDCFPAAVFKSDDSKLELLAREQLESEVLRESRYTVLKAGAMGERVAQLPEGVRLVYLDVPYGVGTEDWDQKIGKREAMDVLQGIRDKMLSSNVSDTLCVACVRACVRVCMCAR